MRAVLALAAVVLAASACSLEQPDAQTAASFSAPVDSAFPMTEMLRRFQRGLPATAALDDGAGSRDQLVARVMSALETGDTTAIRRLAIAKAEYAYLYFPSSLYAQPPYELPPDVAWMLSEAASDKGRTRLVQRLSGRALAYSGYSCADSSAEGGNRFWRNCTVEYTHPGEGAVSRRLFGAIMERDGEFKILTFANDF